MFLTNKIIIIFIDIIASKKNKGTPYVFNLFLYSICFSGQGKCKIEKLFCM